MKNRERIAALQSLFNKHLGDSPYYRIKKEPSYIFFENISFDPPYKALALYKDSVPPSSLVSSELQSIVASITSYQEIRGQRYFSYGHITDPINVVLEELKAWCRSFQVQRDLNLSITEIRNRLEFVRDICTQELFPSRSWTRSDTQTMLKVLYSVGNQLEEAEKILINEQRATQFHDGLILIKNEVGDVFKMLVFYLSFILRDTSGLSLNAGDLTCLQREDKTTDSLRRTVTGENLIQLVRAANVEEKKETLPRTNPYLMVKEGHIALIDKKLSDLKKDSKTGIDPVFFDEKHKHGIRHFLALHGFLYELTRIQVALQKACELEGLTGKLFLGVLRGFINTLSLYYQFVKQHIQQEMNELNVIVKTVADGTMVFKNIKASRDWLENQKKARERVAPFYMGLEGISHRFNSLYELVEHAPSEEKVIADVKEAIASLEADAHFMMAVVNQDIQQSRSSIHRLSSESKYVPMTGSPHLFSSPPVIRIPIGLTPKPDIVIPVLPDVSRPAVSITTSGP